MGIPETAALYQPKSKKLVARRLVIEKSQLGRQSFKTIELGGVPPCWQRSAIKADSGHD